MDLLKLFSRKPQLVQVRILDRDPIKVRLSEWRSDSALVGSAAKIGRMPEFRRMLDVLSNEHPANAVLSDNVPMELRAVYQARCEGYTICLANLESLARFEPLKEPLEATYEPEEVTDAD